MIFRIYREAGEGIEALRKFISEVGEYVEAEDP